MLPSQVRESAIASALNAFKREHDETLAVEKATAAGAIAAMQVHPDSYSKRVSLRRRRGQASSSSTGRVGLGCGFPLSSGLARVSTMWLERATHVSGRVWVAAAIVGMQVQVGVVSDDSRMYFLHLAEIADIQVSVPIGPPICLNMDLDERRYSISRGFSNGLIRNDTGTGVSRKQNKTNDTGASRKTRWTPRLLRQLHSFRKDKS